MTDETTGAAQAATPKKAVKKAAAKKPRPAPGPKNYLYQLINAAGTAGPISTPYKEMKPLLDDVGLTAAKDDTVVIFREIRRGKLKTKVSISK